MGIRFADPGGAMKMSKALYDAGLWAMFAGSIPLSCSSRRDLVDDAYCDEALSRFADGMRRRLRKR
jgi:hypothetical protein